LREALQPLCVCVRVRERVTSMVLLRLRASLRGCSLMSPVLTMMALQFAHVAPHHPLPQNDHAWMHLPPPVQACVSLRDKESGAQ
jgi:hypothetical protein